jgi:spore maturation protein CgeB
VIESIPEFDLYLVWSRALLPKIRAAGARRAEFLPFGADVHRFRPVAVTESEKRELGSPVCFIGNWDPERERWLDAVADLGLGIWGESWSRARSKRVRNAWRGGAVLGERFLKVVAASTIQLNVLRKQNKGGHNMRTFEIPACGAFLLTERSQDLHLIFRDGDEVATFGDVDELVSAVQRWRDDPAGRDRIARGGHARAAEHAYERRAEELLCFTFPRTSG